MRKLYIIALLLLLVLAPSVWAALSSTGINPIVVTAGADDDEGTITTGNVRVKFVVWADYDETDDTCELQDYTTSETIFKFPANTTAGQPLVSPMLDKRCNGLKIPTNGMDAGTLYIYRSD